MLDFVEDKIEFEKHKLRFLSLFRESLDFGKNPFGLNFKYYLAFEFDFIYHNHFFEGIKCFMSKIECGKIIFYTIEPSPEEYFYKHFQKFSVFEIGIDHSNEDLNQIMMRDPGKNSADALAITSDVIAWFSNSNNWAIIGSRDWEIAILGFTNQDIRQKFIESFSDDAQTMFTSIKTQVDVLDGMLCFDKHTKAEYNNLIECYKDNNT